MDKLSMSGMGEFLANGITAFYLTAFYHTVTVESISFPKEPTLL
ncbi:MAG TPA: hypothetical protein VL866_12330 [Pyrinomonadaceae bacterium]|nr:hypothetical protein [Pyrinomonadaceae bacterium]